mmetsp:Transcript_1138/g.2127  ORF Transcript_1138/g.2127 Transcript_1138/m.2127 type:complete len:398 (-) Transcript_1138:451-1644(-)
MDDVLIEEKSVLVCKYESDSRKSLDTNEFLERARNQNAWIVKVERAERELLELRGMKYGENYTKRLIPVGIDGEHFMNTLSLGNSNNPPLVILHGWGSAAGFFFGNALHLASRFRVYVVDWIGMGGSSRPSFPLGASPEEAENFFLKPLAQWVKWIRKYDNIQDSRKFTLVAHSLGGFLATKFSISFPEQVCNLVLVSPIGLPHPPAQKIHPKMPFLRKMLFKIVFSLWAYDVTPMSVIRFLNLTFRAEPSSASQRLVKAIVTPRYASYAEEEQLKIMDYFYETSAAPGSGEFALNGVLEPGGYARRPLCDVIGEVKVPLDFLYGEKDWVDYRNAEDLRELVSVPMRVHRVKDAGHNVFVDNPEQFNSLVEKICLEFQLPMEFDMENQAVSQSITLT